MPKHSYSRYVLQGAISRGWDGPALAAAVNIEPSRLKSILAGNRELTDRQLRQIEQATGLTGGQLAATTLEPNGGPATELLNGWADVAKALTRRPKSPKARARH